MNKVLSYLYNMPNLGFIRKKYHVHKSKKYIKTLGSTKIKDREFKKNLNEYWKVNYGKKIDPIYHYAFYKIHGVKDVSFIPEHIWYEEIFPILNERNMVSTLSNKEISNLVLPKHNRPKVVVKCVKSKLYSDDNEILSIEEATKIISNCTYDLIIKSTKTGGGKGVSKISYKDNLLLNGTPCKLENLIKMYSGEFVIQECIQQHSMLSEIHPQSLNTIRLVTLRWEGHIRVLLAQLRFGVNKKIVDNASSGGVFCDVNEKGLVAKKAIDLHGKIYNQHPTTHYSFANSTLTVPCWNEIVSEGVRLHKALLHHDMISWDFAVTNNNEVMLVEMNLRGSSWQYQLSYGKPLFGDITTKILQMLK